MPSSKKYEANPNSIRHLLNTYDINLETGEIRNKRTGNDSAKFQHFKGQSYSNTRYKQVQVYYQAETYKVSAHRIIWAVKNGRWPAEGMVVDHLNSDTSDNRISNLMEVSIADNARRINQRKENER